MAPAAGTDKEAAGGVITFGTGALIAIERRKDRMLRVLRAAEQTSTPIVIPAVVVAEWWRGRPTKRMSMLLDGVTIEPVRDHVARSAGEAIAATGATTIDAIVMASAALRGGVVYTSNVDDLARLGRYFPELRVLGV